MKLKELIEYYDYPCCSESVDVDIPLLGFACRASNAVKERHEKIQEISSKIIGFLNDSGLDADTDCELIVAAMKKVLSVARQRKRDLLKIKLEQEASEIGEIWKPIPGTDGKYQASNLGRIKSPYGRISIGSSDSSGYTQYQALKINGKRENLVHRIIALTFIDNPENKPFVNHKDEDCMNNRVSNLEWVTEKENSNWGSIAERRSLTLGKRVACLDIETNELIKEFDTISLAADWITSKGLSKREESAAGNIGLSIHNKTKTAYGYRWIYLDPA